MLPRSRPFEARYTGHLKADQWRALIDAHTSKASREFWLNGNRAAHNTSPREMPSSFRSLSSHFASAAIWRRACQLRNRVKNEVPMLSD